MKRLGFADSLQLGLRYGQCQTKVPVLHFLPAHFQQDCGLCRIDPCMITTDQKILFFTGTDAVLKQCLRAVAEQPVRHWT